jgi:hypothetical protein
MTFAAHLPAAERVHDWQCPTCRLAARARDDLIVLPNNPLVVAAFQAICAGGSNARMLDGGWRRNKSGFPVYEFWNGAGGRIVVRVGVSDAAVAWDEVKSYSSLTLDVATSVLSGLASDAFRQFTCAPRRAPVTLGAALVLQGKGYRRYGAERSDFALAMAAEMDKLERLRFEIISYPGFDPQTRRWKRDGVTRSDVALVEVAFDDALEPANDRTACAYARPLRFGAWAEHWLNSAGMVWTAQVPREILRLDHRENRGADPLAKRIALRRIGMLPRLDMARPAHSGRIADRLDEALLRLSEQTLLFSQVRADAALQLRAANRRWFEDWLESEIVFHRPDPAGVPS